VRGPASRRTPGSPSSRHTPTLRSRSWSWLRRVARATRWRSRSPSVSPTTTTRTGTRSEPGEAALLPPLGPPAARAGGGALGVGPDDALLGVADRVPVAARRAGGGRHRLRGSRRARLPPARPRRPPPVRRLPAPPVGRRGGRP